MIYSKNSCWLDCFIILHIFIYIIIIYNLIEVEALGNNNILDNNKLNKILELYNLYNIDKENENLIKKGQFDDIQDKQILILEPEKIMQIVNTTKKILM